MASKNELVEEALTKLLGTMPDSLKMLLDASRRAAQPLPDTAAGRDIRQFLTQQGSLLSLQLDAFSSVARSDRFQGRVLLYEFDSRPASQRWQLAGVEYAHSLALPRDGQYIIGLVDHLATKADSDTFIGAWLHPLSNAAAHHFFLYLRHSSGLDVGYLVSGGKFALLPFTGDELSAALTAVIPSEPKSRDFWKRVLEAVLVYADSECRSPVEAFFKERLDVELAPEVWVDLLRLLFLRDEYLLLHMESARALSSRPLQESHVLLQAVVTGLTNATEHYTEQISQLEKDHKRDIKRRISDHEKLQVAYRGLLNRANRQAEELARATRVAAPVPKAEQVGGGAAAASLNKSLAALF